MSVNCAGRHVCEPDFYPAAETDRWTCDECGTIFFPFPIADSRLSERVRKMVKPGQLGWTTARPE